MTQLFESKTGKFTPLSDDQLAGLSENQRTAYDEVAASVAALADADIAAKDLQARVQADVVTLNEAERTAPKYDASAAHTRLVKEMIASNRRD